MVQLDSCAHKSTVELQPMPATCWLSTVAWGIVRELMVTGSFQEGTEWTITRMPDSTIHRREQLASKVLG